MAEKAFRQAAREAPENAALCAHAEQELAWARLVAGDLPGASRWANTSLCSARQAADQRLVAHSLARVALVKFLQGHGAQSDLFEKDRKSTRLNSSHVEISYAVFCLKKKKKKKKKQYKEKVKDKKRTDR